MISTIIGFLNAIVAFGQLLMHVYKAFKKTPQEQVDKAKDKVNEEEKEFDETGRPKK
jgi:molybdenum-dependent DNA-binding transcriptional regulator ModE